MAQLVSDFVKRMAPFFKALGFTRSGLKYSLAYGENRALIQFQSSLSSTKEAAKITVNLGTWNRRVATFDDPEAANRDLVIDCCHWNTRLGNLRTPPQDEWWTIEGGPLDGTVQSAVEELLIDKGLPELQSLSADQSLRDLWLSGRAPGRTAFQRLYGLSILLAEIGPFHRLPSVLKELGEVTRRGGMHFSVSSHERRLQALGYWTGEST
ncbi:MAG TPA: DUF4304 domain-containing protein [Gemmatimonadaceae bacterium]